MQQTQVSFSRYDLRYHKHLCHYWQDLSFKQSTVFGSPGRQISSVLDTCVFFTLANGILQRHQVAEKTKEMQVLPVWENPGPKSSVSEH